MEMKEIFKKALSGDTKELKEKLEILITRQRSTLNRSKISPICHIECFFREYGELIKEYDLFDTLIDIAAEIKAPELIVYIAENIETVCEDIEKVKQQMNRLADALIKIGNIKFMHKFAKIKSEILPIDALSKIENDILESKNLDNMIKFMALGRNTPIELLVENIDKIIDGFIKEGNINDILDFVEEYLERLAFYKNEFIFKSVKKLIDFVVATNNPKYIYRFASYNRLGQNHDLLNALIKINIPAFVYLFAVTIENISEDDMKLIVAYMLTTNDTKLIGYLLWYLRDKNNVSNDLKFALQNKLNESNDKYWFISYDVKTPDKLKDALLSDDIQMLAEFGIVLNEDNLYDDKRQLVLSNIQAGL